MGCQGFLGDAFAWVLLHKAVDRPANFIASTVVDGDNRCDGSVVARFVDGFFNSHAHLFRQRGQIPACKDADAMLVVECQLPMDFGYEELHEVGNLLFASFPVLRGEGVEGDKPDALRCRFTYHTLECFQAFKMPGGARKRTLLRPSAVSVHDNAQVDRGNGFLFHPRSP
ncbi:hypothetical protein SDC9_141756 [bioreactor metagenome]|uniref:Uncharacterized protein n=1 Tax=bioreactor metagenome TaxID=1076179 RepID=A0A645DZP4_9ZZZZ